jgi:signal transduction histidine kinase
MFTNLFLDNPEKRDHKLIAEKLIGASQKMQAVISGLQQYVWLTESYVTIKEIDLNKLLQQVQERLTAEFSNTELNLHTDKLPSIHADEAQIKMLFYQLLSNAIRYRKPGNKVVAVIAADIVKRNKFKNVAGKYEYTDFLKLQIKDEGIGFDPKYTEQAFDLFRRLHTESGLGIGLSLCKKIAENHYGSITINAMEGSGTTVTVLLPQQHFDQVH